MLRLVAVRELDVGEVDVERCAGLDHRVRFRERLGERLDARERPVGRRVHVREVDHRAHPVEPPSDLDHVVDRAELAHPAHHLDPERHAALLCLEALAQLAELLHDGVDGVLPAAPE